MKTITELKCPSCNADLSIDESREYIFCQFCGTKVLLNDENQYTVNLVDSAEITRAETEQMVQKKEMELAEEHVKQNKKIHKLRVIIALSLFSVGMICFLIGKSNAELVGLWCLCGALFISITLFDSNHTNKKIRHITGPDEIIITPLLCFNKGQHFSSVEMKYKAAGFINVSVIPLRDLNVFQIKQNGQVESVTIGGDFFYENDVYKKTDTVVITYHSRM